MQAGASSRNSGGTFFHCAGSYSYLTSSREGPRGTGQSAADAPVADSSNATTTRLGTNLRCIGMPSKQLMYTRLCKAEADVRSLYGCPSPCRNDLKSFGLSLLQILLAGRTCAAVSIKTNETTSLFP